MLLQGLTDSFYSSTPTTTNSHHYACCETKRPCKKLGCRHLHAKHYTSTNHGRKASGQDKRKGSADVSLRDHRKQLCSEDFIHFKILLEFIV